jgi:PAS domain S-box-containing protein
MSQSKKSALHANTPFARATGEGEIRTALEAADIGVWDWNLVTGEVAWSDNLERIHGFAPGTFGGTFDAYLADIHPEDREAVLASIERTLSGRREHDVEYRIVLGDGAVRWVSGRGRLIADAAGQPVRMVGTCQDVTKRREGEEALAALRSDFERKLAACAAELVRARDAAASAESKLRQLQKVDAVGRLTAGIVHDFNNLLTVISGSSELALRRMSQDDPARGRVAEIRKAATRGAALTRRLLAYSRDGAPEPKVVDLNAAIADTSAMLRRLIGDDVELVVLPDPSFCCVRVEAGWVDQVLINLVVNARDAMQEGGQIVVETRKVDTTEPVSDHEVELKPGCYVILSVADTGCGMDSGTLERIFEPFFTTKHESHGMGIGLSTVHGIVREAGGAIRVTSTPGGGTTFTIFLPLAAGEAEEGEAGAPPPRPIARGSVLLVEADAAVRRLVRDILEAAGHDTIEARDGFEAVDLCEDLARPIDILVADARMPRLASRALAETIRTLRPGIGVVLMTEGPDAGASELARGDRCVVVEKPFGPDALIRCVQEAMGAEGRAR